MAFISNSLIFLLISLPGALALVLALGLPPGLPGQSQIVIAAFGS